MKQYISHITEKFTNSDIKNIIYYPLNNCFDICIEQLGHNIINNAKSNFEIQHHLTLLNSVTSLATSPITESAGCFIHSSRPVNLKKEDLYLMQQRTDRTHKILFNAYTQQSWGFSTRTHIINYGIPDSFKILHTETRSNVAIFNLQNNPEISNVIVPMIKNTQIPVLEINSISNIEEKLNSCSVAIEMYEHNVINSLCAIACGCVALMPKTNYIDSAYKEIQTFENINNMMSILKNSNLAIPKLEDRYSFDAFKIDMNQILNIITDEVYVL
jgi:hypothetical protein